MKRLFIITIFIIVTSVLYGQEAEEQKAPETVFRKGPYLIYPGKNTQMTVMWQTYERVDGAQLEWKKVGTQDVKKETVSPEEENLYSHTISDLEPQTRYEYSVTAGRETYTSGFITGPDYESTKVTIYGYGDTRSRPEDHDAVCRTMLNDIDALPDTRQTILLHSGDWVGAGDSETCWDREYFNPASKHAKQLLSRVPVMGCRGNHEQTGLYLRIYWPYNYKSGSGFYYSFNYGPVHIIVIDQYKDYSPGSTQYEWIEKDLESTSRKWKIALFHEPAYSAPGNHAGNEETIKHLCPLLERYKVAVVLAGHNHFYSRCHKNGIAHITTGGGGAPRYKFKERAAGVAAAESVLHFVRIDIDGDIMNVEAIRDDGSILDSFTLTLTGLGPVRHWWDMVGVQGVIATISALLLLGYGIYNAGTAKKRKTAAEEGGPGSKRFLFADIGTGAAVLTALYLVYIRHLLDCTGGRWIPLIGIPTALAVGLSIIGLVKGRKAIKIISALVIINCVYISYLILS
jgi:predicted phosphodiesterase